MALKIVFIVMFMATCSVALPMPQKTEVVDIVKDNVKDIIIDQIVDVMNNGTNIQGTIIKNVKITVAKVDQLMKDVENKLIALTNDIGIINSERIKATKEAITTYRSVKSTLRVARNELKRLADKTIRTTGDLILYMEAWDSESKESKHSKEYLKEQATILRELVAESKIILGDAKTKYDESADKIDIVNSKLETLKRGMDQMLDENSAEHDKWTAELRGGVYGTAGASTVGFIIADIFGCLGICSAVGIPAVWGTGVVSVETKIAEVTAKIEQMEESVVNAAKDIDTIATQTKTIQVFIQEETLIIIKWEKSVDHLANKIDDIKEASFYRLALKRRAFTEALKGLSNAAQEFWDRPDGIFGEEPLKEKVNGFEAPESEKKALNDIKEKRNELEECLLNATHSHDRLKCYEFYH